jgi:hypothetical protein
MEGKREVCEAMSTSEVESAAMRLLGAFYDLSGGKLNEPVGEDEAARGAGIEPGSTELDVAVRYLLGQGYVRASDTPSAYRITVPGVDKAREARGLSRPAASGEERSGMSEKMQRRLLTLIAIPMALAISQPLTRYIGEQIPERRGIKDDLAEAVLKGLARTAAIFLASLLVRQLAEWRRG